MYTLFPTSVMMSTVRQLIYSFAKRIYDTSLLEKYIYIFMSFAIDMHLQKLCTCLFILAVVSSVPCRNNPKFIYQHLKETSWNLYNFYKNALWFPASSPLSACLFLSISLCLCARVCMHACQPSCLRTCACLRARGILYLLKVCRI